MREKAIRISAKILFLCAVGIGLWWIYWQKPEFYRTMFVLTLAGDVQGLSDYLASFGCGAIAISVVMIVLSNAVGLPSIPFLTVNGIIFGLVPGIIISWIGEVVGIEIGFVVTRVFFRNHAKNMIERHHMLEKLDSYSNIRTMALARAVPYSPNVLFTAIGALSRLSFRDHTIATILGKVPAVVVEVWLGHDLAKLDEHGLRCVLLLLLVAVVYIWMRRHKKTDT